MSNKKIEPLSTRPACYKNTEGQDVHWLNSGSPGHRIARGIVGTDIQIVDKINEVIDAVNELKLSMPGGKVDKDTRPKERPLEYAERMLKSMKEAGYYYCPYCNDTVKECAHQPDTCSECGGSRDDPIWTVWKYAPTCKKSEPLFGGPIPSSGYSAASSVDSGAVTVKPCCWVCQSFFEINRTAACSKHKPKMGPEGLYELRYKHSCEDFQLKKELA